MGTRGRDHRRIDLLTRRHARGLVPIVLGLGACAGAGGAPPPPPPAADPIPAYFTEEQADRGQRVFGSICSTCHGRNDFTGPIFGLTWMAEPVGALFEHISTSMPQDAPGSLSTDQYAAIVAHLLRLNGRAAGDVELPVDPSVLARMRW